MLLWQAFGEASLVTIWRLNNGILPAGGNFTCMEGQLRALANMDLFSKGVLGNTCEISVSGDDAVPK